jgi:hypothetical protein
MSADWIPLASFCVMIFVSLFATVFMGWVFWLIAHPELDDR